MTAVTIDEIESALSSGEIISLKTGNRYNRELVERVHQLYIEGKLYPRKFFKVFGLSKPKQLTNAFTQCNLKLLSFKESRELYGREIIAETKETNLQKFGVDNPSKSKEIREKVEATNIQKFGETSPLKSKEFRRRIEETNLQKYGSPYVMGSDHFKEMNKRTLSKKYGVTHNSKIPEVLEKRKETNLLRYGVTCPFGDHPNSFGEIKIRDRIKETWIEKYSVDNPSKSKEIRELALTTWRSRDERLDTLFKLEEGSEGYDDETKRSFVLSNYSGSQRFKNLRRLRVFNKRQSDIETKVEDILSKLGADGMFVKNFRGANILSDTGNAMELDFWFPELRLAIEVNGSFFHNENHKGKFYHVDKFIKCYQNNIKLINLWDDAIEGSPEGG